MKKVIIQTIVPSPFRVKFFNTLGALCDLTVVFEGRRPNNGRVYNWEDNDNMNYKAIYLSEIYNENRVNFKILPLFLEDEYDIKLISCYFTKTAMLLITTMKILGKKYYIESDGAIVRKDESFVNRKLKEFLLSGAEKYLSTSKTTDDYFRYYSKTDSSKIFRYRFTSVSREQLVDNIYSCEQKKELKKSLNINYDLIILSVGQFIHRKGYDILLKSLGKIKLSDNVGIYLIGGDETEEYRLLREKYNLTNIHYIKFLPSNLLFEYYKCADIFVLPTREDIWGLVVNEAMSCGLPIVTTDKCVAGLELLNSEDGVIVPVEDIDALAYSLELLLNDKERRERIGLRNLSTIHNYCFDNMVDDHIKIFSE